MVYKVKGKTSYLGDEYSYSHAAAEKLSGGELKGYTTMTQALKAVGSDCEYAVVPLENNVEGVVNEVYDAISDLGLYMIRQLVLPVRHSLIVEEGKTIEDIERVVSHPQAIAQCRKFLDKLGVPVGAVSSTSAALKEVGGGTAAIAFRPRAGQTAIKSGIQDSELNATRFALFSQERESSGGTVSASFDLPNAPGALLRPLQTVYDSGVNLTRILSRPHRDGSGRYRFFIDFDFNGSDEELEEFLKRLESCCTSFRFLGRYDVEILDPRP